jgi:hypothetical protein
VYAPPLDDRDASIDNSARSTSSGVSGTDAAWRNLSEKKCRPAVPRSRGVVGLTATGSAAWTATR